MALENEGVECVFGVPGEENLDFLDRQAAACAMLRPIAVRGQPTVSLCVYPQNHAPSYAGNWVTG